MKNAQSSHKRLPEDREEMREQRRVFMDAKMCLGPVRDDSYARVLLTPQKQGCQTL